MKVPQMTRQAFIRLGAALPLLMVPPAAFGEDNSLSSIVRRAVVRSAQFADQADSVWQQVSGEVVPAWQQPQSLATAATPPPFLDQDFAAELLALPLEVGAKVAGVSTASLTELLPAARAEAILLYASGAAGPKPLLNEPFYGNGASEAAAGTARRAFARELATAADQGEPVGNATLFNFESYVRWRVLQDLLSDKSKEPAERRRLQRRFSEQLGMAMLKGPLRGASLPAASPVGAASSAPAAGAPRTEGSLKSAVSGCGALLELMQSKGLFSRHELQLTLGSGTDLFDEGDWAAGGSTSWQYVVSGSAVVGGSQLAQDRTAATGMGAGFFPGQYLTAPLAAYLAQQGIRARIDEYFLDNRVGRPDPRTFSDPRYYSDTLLEIVALEES